MKKIFLIGDSIRYGHGKEGKKNGYGYYVEEKLKGKCIVYAPNDNCRFLQYTLRYLHEWIQNLGIKGEEIDIIHWNNGLWDVLRILEDEPLTSIEMYKIMLNRVYKRIKKLFPNAKIIFALTTPVTEELMSEDFLRRNTDIEKYNEAAVEVLKPLGVVINDLYKIGKEIRGQYYYDAVHYNEKGSELLAEEIIKLIEKI